MLSKKLIESLRKQKYGIVGKHSAVQVCTWTKKSLVDLGFCYKQKFYGIKSHECCEMTPFVDCNNRCLHCWRTIELTEGKKIKNNESDSPSAIINESMKERNKLTIGFKGNIKLNKKKYLESLDPKHFAISLIGEPTLYPKLGEFLSLLRKSNKTSFLVTNGLQPEVLTKLSKKKQLPTQLYLSLNTPDKKLYEKWHRSLEKNAWKKFNKTLKLFQKLKTRKVIRITLVRGLNMNDSQVSLYAKLFKIAKPDFIEVKGFMSVGAARSRLGYELMPKHNEIKLYAKKLAEKLKDSGYKILDEHKISHIVLIGKYKNKMKIKKSEI
jgi:tRNA wybutosine-synthesizing protein 1